MAKDQVEEIKSKIDIVEFINESLPLKKAGRNFKANCPFHKEDTPSFVVSPERQIFKCFGCSESGDVIAFLMKSENLDFGEALEILAKRAGVKLERFAPQGKEAKRELLYRINHLASEYYHYLLLSHKIGKKALDYLLARGITKESIKSFKIGYAPDFWDGLISFLVTKKKFNIRDLVEAGLVIKSQRGNNFYDRFRDRIVFPLLDHRGNICGFSGRILSKDARQAKYINTPETFIYHKSDLLFGLEKAKEVIKEEDEVVVVEGEMDVISPFQIGVKNIVAIKGTALTEEQLKLLSRFTKNIKLALDKDIAGDLAAKRAIEEAEKLEMTVKVVAIEGGKDPDEVAQKNPEALKQQIKEAVSIYDFIIESALKRFNQSDFEGKRKIAQEVIPYLWSISSKVVQAYFVKRLAEALDVSEDVVNSEIESFGKKQQLKTSPYKALTGFKKQDKLSRRQILENYIFSLVFQSGDWKRLTSRKIKPLVKTARFVRIIEVLSEYLKKYKRMDSKKLAAMLPAELRDTFDNFYLAQEEIVEDKERLEKELEKATIELEKITLREELERISKEIKNLEGQKGKKNQRDKLYDQFKDLTEKLKTLA